MVESLHKRLLLISLACMMAFNLMVPAALGDEGGGGSHNFDTSYPTWGTVWYGPTGTGGVASTMYVRYGVVAWTQYDAAVFCCSGSSLDFDSLTPAKKAKLLGDNDFSAFAQLFKVGKPELTDDWVHDSSVVFAWNQARDLYGETYCYSALYTNDQKIRAQEYLYQVMQEDDGSGGGGPVSAGETIFYQNYYYVPVVTWGAGWVGNPAIQYLRPNTAYFDNMKAFADERGWKIYGFISNGGDTSMNVNNQSNRVSAWLFACDPDNITFNSDDYSISFGSSFETYVIRRDGWNKSNNQYQVSTVSLPNVGNVNYLPLTTQNNNYSMNEGTWSVQVSSSGVWPMAPLYYVTEYVEGDGGGDEPVEPPVTWPDPPTPVTPNPPEVPTPPDPNPPEPPDPTPPDPPTPWVPIPGPDDDPITGDEFQDLIDALAEHCQHIRDAMSGNFEQLWTNQSDLLVTEFASTRDTLTDNLHWLGNDIIAQGFTDLSSYLNDLFEWLAEQMQFNINVSDNPYDDSSVLYWLKRIWSKLGGGDINIRPTDPVTDNDEWWAWLLQLMDNFVGFLLGFGLDKLGDVGSALQSLTGKFPFSLPWDLAALFGLLVAPPQTPAVDFPCYTVGLEGIQQVGVYHLSLADYNDAWEQVRWLERVSFCILLIKSSDFFTSLLGKVFGK